MVHSEKRKKGTLIPHDTPVQIMLNKHATYQHMLDRCRKAVYPSEQGQAQYYVANSTGAAIWCGDVITMDMSDGSTKSVPWTLEMYLKCSKKKYPSRARFYCVKNVCGKLQSNMFYYSDHWTPADFGSDDDVNADVTVDPPEDATVEPSVDTVVNDVTTDVTADATVDLPADATVDAIEATVNLPTDAVIDPSADFTANPPENLAVNSQKVPSGPGDEEVMGMSIEVQSSATPSLHIQPWFCMIDY